MKFTKLEIILLISTIAIVVASCVSPINNPDISKPSITIFKPASGDTIEAVKNRNVITYQAKAGIGSKGISYYEVFVNNKFVERFQQNKNGSNPTLYLNVDSTLVNKKISYYVIVYNLENKLKTSKVIDNVLVLENTRPPAAPKNLTLDRISDTQVLLFWDDSSTTETSYEVWRKDGTDGNYRVVRTLPKNSNNFRDVGLSPYITYFYKVRAINQYGASPFSNEVNTGGAGGSAPSNLTAQALGASYVQLNWQDNSTAENGFKIQRRNLDSDPWSTIKILPPNTVEYLDEGLTQQTTYHYRVGSFTSNSEAYSGEVTVTTKSVDVPAPSNLVANFNKALAAVKVTWSDNTNLENGTIIERKEGVSGTFRQIGIAPTDVTQFLDSNITATTLYYYRARHSTTEGFFTPYSNIDTAYVPTIPLAAPSNLEINEFVPNKVYGLFWTNNAKIEDGIELWKRVQGDTYHAPYKILPPRTHAFNDTLTDGSKIYYYKVRAFLGGEYSTFSNEVSTAGGTGGLFRPTNLVAKVVPNQLAVDLTWSDNSNNELGFEIERRLVGSNSFKRIAIVAPNTTFYRDATNGLYRGSSYEYRVRAYNGQGYSDYSNIYLVTIPY